MIVSTLNTRHEQVFVDTVPYSAGLSSLGEGFKGFYLPDRYLRILTRRDHRGQQKVVQGLSFSLGGLV